MKFNKIIIICVAVLILAVTPVVIAEAQRSKSITIRTGLSDDCVISSVRLSDGVLYFKTDEEVERQYDSSYADKADEMLERIRGLGLLWGLPKGDFEQEDLKVLLNLQPELWKIPGDFTPWRSFFNEPEVCANSDKSFFAVTNPIFEYRYDNRERYEGENQGIVMPRELVIQITDSDIELIPPIGGGSVYRNGVYLDIWHWPGFEDVTEEKLPCRVFGDMDSRIGEIPAAVCNMENPNRTHFTAMLKIANAGYYIEALGLTQREFTELLISICEAPHSETQSVLDYILQNNTNG